MARKVKITEQQYQMLQEEDMSKVNITLDKNDVKQSGSVESAVQGQIDKATQAGTNPEKLNINVPGDIKNESRIITKQKLIENRMKALKAHSRLYTVKDFLNVKS